MFPRLVNLAIGLWLFLSAFLWRHTRAQFDNAWIVGVAVVTLALWALAGRTWTRFFNVALGGWLMLSTVLLPTGNGGTLWNHVLCGLALVAFGSQPRGWRPSLGPAPAVGA